MIIETIETNSTKRAQLSHKKKPTPAEEPAGLPHGTLLEQERQRVRELEQQLRDVKQQVVDGVSAIDSWKDLADKRSDRIKELEEELAAARWSTDQYRKDNEFKAGILQGLWEKQRESRRHHVGGDYGPPNWTGHQRVGVEKTNPKDAVIHHLLRALVEATS